LLLCDVKACWDENSFPHLSQGCFEPGGIQLVLENREIIVVFFSLNPNMSFWTLEFAPELFLQSALNILRDISAANGRENTTFISVFCIYLLQKNPP